MESPEIRSRIQVNEIRQTSLKDLRIRSKAGKSTE